MQPEGSLLHSQELANCPYPESDRSSASALSHFSKTHFTIILLSTRGVSTPKPCMHLYSPPYELRAPSVSSFSISSFEQYLVSSRDHTAPLSVVFSTPLLPRPSWTQISSSAPYSRKPSAYVPPLI